MQPGPAYCLSHAPVSLLIVLKSQFHVSIGCNWLAGLKIVLQSPLETQLIVLSTIGNKNEVVSMLRECKQSFFNLQLNNADTKTFWKTVCSLKQMSSSTIPTLHDGDKTARTSLDKATTLNNFFYTCFNHTQPPLCDTDQDFSLCPSECPGEFLCTEDSVFELLTKLDTRV